jgi:hypothetical protein
MNSNQQLQSHPHQYAQIPPPQYAFHQYNTIPNLQGIPPHIPLNQPPHPHPHPQTTTPSNPQPPQYNPTLLYTQAPPHLKLENNLHDYPPPPTPNNTASLPNNDSSFLNDPSFLRQPQSSLPPSLQLGHSSSQAQNIPITLIPNTQMQLMPTYLSQSIQATQIPSSNTSQLQPPQTSPEIQNQLFNNNNNTVNNSNTQMQMLKMSFSQIGEALLNYNNHNLQGYQVVLKNIGFLEKFIKNINTNEIDSSSFNSKDKDEIITCINNLTSVLKDQITTYETYNQQQKEYMNHVISILLSCLDQRDNL